MIDKKKFREYLNRKYLEWQLSTGNQQSMVAWAEYLGVNYSSLMGWVNGAHPPNDINIKILADKLGYEIYDILGKTRPDPLIEGIKKELPANIPPELQGQLLEDHKKFIREWASKYGIPIKDRDT